MGDHKNVADPCDPMLADKNYTSLKVSVAYLNNIVIRKVEI